MILDRKYVFHIPLFKFEDGKLIEIQIDDVLDDLISRLNLDSLYVSRVESHYKSRIFDEILITVFVDSSAHPEEIFKDWFWENNDVLKQESFAYESDEGMHIFDLS